MLKGISPKISPELLFTIASMGHGDELLLADAHFPGHSCNDNTLRADGNSVTDLLDALLPLFELDAYVDDNVVMMSPIQGESADLQVEISYRQVLQFHSQEFKQVMFIERMAFYERARNAYAVVMTSETRKYGNVIIKKGVTTV